MVEVQEYEKEQRSLIRCLIGIIEVRQSGTAGNIGPEKKETHSAMQMKKNENIVRLNTAGIKEVIRMTMCMFLSCCFSIFFSVSLNANVTVAKLPTDLVKLCFIVMDVLGSI